MLCEYCGRFNKNNKKEDCSSCGALLPRDKGEFIVHPPRNYSNINGIHVVAGSGGGGWNCAGGAGGTSIYGGAGDGRTIYKYGGKE